MSRFRYYLTDSRTLALVGVAVVAGMFLLGSNTLKMLAFWAAIVLGVALLVLLALWLSRHLRARRAAAQLNEAVTHSGPAGREANSAETEALRERMREAIKAIKTSRLGQTKGTAALYELPWYMVIGNPAAGKSTAVINSGLRFPFADKQGNVVQGIGGTRNCDWYFTTEGILLDTAGRYSVHEEDRSEWLTFLELLRKNRPLAPINGIIIAASIAELTGNRPEFSINLAKNLRQRVQELTEQLEVIAPVYVVFTKADLISGFSDFFRTLDPAEREKVWGATLPFQPGENKDAVDLFDRYFDELSEGLKEMSLSQMALNRGKALSPGLLTLPLEFTGIKSTLRTFITTLFEDNPYQFKPVFRGFYFTSAIQETASVHHASEQIAKRFGLSSPPASSDGGIASKDGYFLLDLFRKVIFTDRQLVQQYSSRNRARTRYAVLIGSALALGLVLAGWAWSYTSNRQLITNVRADLDKVVEVQKDRVDLQSRLQALELIEDRLEQLQAYRDDHPLALGLGLYQGDKIEEKLRGEFFAGMRSLMLNPTSQGIEAYLNQVVAHRGELKPIEPGTASASADASKAQDTDAETYQAASPTNVQDAYNALKAYLMLADPSKVEQGHLSDQLTRFWRVWLDANRGMMSRDELIRSAQRLMNFYIAQAGTPGWPTIDAKVSLVDDSRQALSQVMRGLPARDRVYAEIKARAATRFAPVTVARILGDQDSKLLKGSYAISGTFSREAWEGYVRDAIRDAANKELNTTDWVLQAAQQEDLTLSGSPEHIQKELEGMYANEYVREWKKFLQNVSVAPFASFGDAVNGMNSLGDAQNSPIRKLLDHVYQQTSWDNPSLVNAGLKQAQSGFGNWFKRTILRQQPRGVNLDINLQGGGDIPVGPVGKEFAGVARLMIARDNNPPLLQSYLDVLSRLRTRLNQIKTQGDPGPGSRELMVKTLDGSGSELSSGLQLVDEQMLTGISDSQRQTLRPLLLRPLIQTFSALIPPTQQEINRVWSAQVYQPFNKDLAQKYPFDTHGQVEAATSEIAQVFGPDGAIAKFSSDTLGPLVVRRGNVLTAKQWADLGITLSPQLMTNFSQWVAPLGQTTEGAAQVVFQLTPGPAAGGISEYIIQIGDQQLRYRNTPPQPTSFVWDTSQTNQTAKISVITLDGRTVELAFFTGKNALGQLMQSASSTPGPDKSYQMKWTKDDYSVPVTLKVVSNPLANADGSQRKGLNGTSLPATVVGADSGTTPPAQAEGGNANAGATR